MNDPLPRPASGLTIPPKGRRAGPQLGESQVIVELKAALAAGRSGALDEFWESVIRVGTPLVEDAPGDNGAMLVTFVARESDPALDVVVLANRVTEPDAYDSSVLRPIADTDLRYLTVRMRSDWRGSYGIGRVPSAGPVDLPEHAREMIESSVRIGSPAPRIDLERWFGAMANAGPDPLQKRQGHWEAYVAEGSWVSLPDAPPARVTVRPEGPAGTLRETRFTSRLLGNERPVWTYVTAGTEAAEDRWLLVLTDGAAWAKGGAIGAVLDEPCATGELPPMTVVMIDAIDVPTRTRELACSQEFVDAVTKELLPALPEVGDRRVPERTIIAGSSLGGLTAAYAVMRAPETFGNAYSMSGSFWWPSTTVLGEEPAWLSRCYAVAPKLPARFRLEVGLQEQGLLGFTRHMRDVLQAKGYEVSYSEFNGGHDRLCWVAGFAEGLKQLTAGR